MPPHGAKQNKNRLYLSRRSNQLSDLDVGTTVVPLNTAETIKDSDILFYKDHPVQFPFSAAPSLAVKEYAAEKMANAVEHGEDNVRTHAKSIPIGKNLSKLKGKLKGTDLFDLTKYTQIDLSPLNWILHQRIRMMAKGSGGWTREKRV